MTNKPLLYLIIALLIGVIGLGVSTAILYTDLQSTKKKLQESEAAVASQKTQTQTCNDSVAKLEQDAIDNAAANATAVKQAKKDADARVARAQRILKTPASTPGNDCKSAQDRVQSWLKERGQ